jgi:hypothetical protein
MQVGAHSPFDGTRNQLEILPSLVDLINKPTELDNTRQCVQLELSIDDKRLGSATLLINGSVVCLFFGCGSGEGMTSAKLTY